MIHIFYYLIGFIFICFSTLYSTTFYAESYLNTNINKTNLNKNFICNKNKKSIFTPAKGIHPNKTGKIKISSDQLRFLPPVRLSDRLKKLNRAIPTNKWWTNLILTDENNKNKNELEPPLSIYSNPFRLDFILYNGYDGLSICYASQYRIVGPINENGGPNYYFHSLNITDISLSAIEFQFIKPSIEIIDWNDGGVHISYFLPNPYGSFESCLIIGMAYISVDYKDLTPLLITQHIIIRINDILINDLLLNDEKHVVNDNIIETNNQITDHSNQTFNSTKLNISNRYIIELDNNQIWIMYTSIPFEFMIKNKNTIEGMNPYNGTIRLALLPNIDNNKTELVQNNIFNIYDKYKSCYVIGYEIQAFDSYEYRIKWKTKGDCSNGLLHFGLSHHINSLFLEEKNTNLYKLNDLILFTPTRGPIYGVVSFDLEWKLYEKEILNISFYPYDRNISKEKELFSTYDFINILKKDIDNEEKWTFQIDGSYYFNGKLAQKYASLCLIVYDISIVLEDDTENHYLKDKCIHKLNDLFNIFIDNTWTYPFVYDSVYGGIVSSEAFITNNTWADFGNSVYNDHHYHYGYWIVASSIFKNLNPFYNKINELNNIIELLIRDVVNSNDTIDIYFPKFRHFDWYLGHSYSHGISSFPDGKDEESFSEEINFYYGLILWGALETNEFNNIHHNNMTNTTITNNNISCFPNYLEEMGKLMIKLNKRAINTYFLMINYNDDLNNSNLIHPYNYYKNSLVGIFFDNKVDYATWFSPERECIHGIQMIPVSFINKFIKYPEYIKQEWNEILSKLDLIRYPKEYPSTWQSLLFCNIAIINKTYAIENLLTVPMDDGLSRSWAIYNAILT